MLRVVTVSSSTERANADRLAGSIRTAWPDIAASQDGLVTIAAGVRLARESDLIVAIELERPRSDGVQAGVIVIEVKALDPSRLIAVGNDLRPVYAGTPERRTVLEQLKDQIDGIAHHFARYGGERCFVHGIVWMTGATSAELRERAPDLSPLVVGNDATWLDMLAAAATQNASLLAPAPAGYRAAVRLMREKLTTERQLTARDKTKLDRFTTETLTRDVVDDCMQHLGEGQIRLVGRAGCGKSTALALLAKRAVELHDARVLVLTYHRTLRAELEHLVRSLCGGGDGRVVVLEEAEFLHAAFAELGGELPRDADGGVDYGAMHAAVPAFLQSRSHDELASDAAVLREVEPLRFAFDYVFVDEAQDWGDADRDVLRLFFKPEQMVLADGRDQFAQRQSRCNWSAGVVKERRHVRELNRSLRMSCNVAAFCTAFARAADILDWEVRPHPDLPGGRIILSTGGMPDALFVERVLALARDATVDPGDCLVAVPPRDRRANGLVTIDTELRARGIAVWNAVDAAVRRTTRQPQQLPLVYYHSLRGLEGWATVLLGLDRWDDNRLRHPNLEPGDAATPDDVARNGLLLALTRAAHVLAISAAPESRVARWLAQAASEMQDGVVERW